MLADPFGPIVFAVALLQLVSACKLTLFFNKNRVYQTDSNWKREGPPGSCMFHRVLLLGRASLLS